MGTDLIVNHIQNNLLIILFIICMAGYFIYSTAKTYKLRSGLLKKKKDLEGELETLDKQYKEKTEAFEAQTKERVKSFKERQK
ncbi:hypothetical protein ACFLZ2_03780 [Candidatus Margulisiibacteriota bacterium]